MFKFDKKLLGWLFLSLFLFAGLSTTFTNAQAKEGGSDERTLLRIMYLPTPTDVGASAKVGRTLVSEFSKKYPQYKLEPFHMLSIKGGGMDEGPLMAIATGVPAHGVYVNFRQSSTYINHGFLVPMEIILARILSSNEQLRLTDDDGNWLADPSEEEIADAIRILKSKVIPAVWPVIYREAEPRAGVPTGKHVWALPYGTLVNALIYRKDVFNEAGLDPEKPPRDWDEFLEYCRIIKQCPGKYGFTYGRGPSVSYSVFNFMVANGVRYMKQDKEGRWYAAFNTMNAAEAIYYVMQLTRGIFTADGKEYEGCVYAPVGSSEKHIMWNRGDIGMRFSYLSFDQAKEINPAMTGVAPPPATPDGQKGNELNCTMMGVFSGSTPEQQLGVMRFIWYRASEEIEKMRTRVMVEQGYGKFQDPATLKKLGYNDILKKIPENWIQTVETAMANGVPEPYGKNTQLIYRKVSVPINWALNRPKLLELPREEALARIKKQLDIAADRVDRFMLGELSPQEWRTRRIWGGLLLAVIIILFSGSIMYVWRAFNKEERALGLRPPARKFLRAYALIFPALALVLIIKYLPLVLGMPLALFDYQFAAKTIFVGLDNFATVLYDPRFWQSFLRTIYYVVLVLGLGFWPPILIATLLDEVPGAVNKYIFRTIFYLPTIVSGIIMIFLWRQG